MSFDYDFFSMLLIGLIFAFIYPKIIKEKFPGYYFIFAVLCSFFLKLVTVSFDGFLVYLFFFSIGVNTSKKFYDESFTDFKVSTSVFVIFFIILNSFFVSKFFTFLLLPAAGGAVYWICTDITQPRLYTKALQLLFTGNVLLVGSAFLLTNF